jgi:hypothetical protein
VNGWLVVAGLLSCLVSVLHALIIFGGAPWYRFFGAGDAMASSAQRGSIVPTLVTASLCIVFLVWSIYAFSGAGILRPLPFLSPALAGIAAIYLFRGALLVPTLFGIVPVRNLPSIKPHDAFTVWSSLISFGIGLAYAIGLVQMR